MKTLEQIAAELPGYNPQALSVNDVLAFLSQWVRPVTQTQALPLFEALGRVLAQDVISPFDVPPHDNSAMDGYAFAGHQLGRGTPLALRVVGTALAGKAWRGAVGLGECVKIMTGAIMPPGLDTVVPQEWVSTQTHQPHQSHSPDTTITITIPAQRLKPGDNRRLRGEDLARGKPALLKGERVTPARLGLAASLGLASLTCWRALRVAYFSTGDEILSLGEVPREGAVYDSNRYTVLSLLSRMGCQVVDLGVVRDEPAALEAAFLQAGAQADAIITSGGVSVGAADHTKTVMKKLADAVFWHIAMRPGRPMAFGRLQTGAGLKINSASAALSTGISSYENNSKPHSAILFGLPGNPVAAMVTFLVFVRPALLQMMGATAAAPPLLKAHSLQVIRKKPGRTEYQRAWVSTAADGSLHVRTTGNQGSGVLSSMAQANGLMVLHPCQGAVEVGDVVDVLMFEGVM